METVGNKICQNRGCEDLERVGHVDLPFALRRKYPNANRDPGWQYLSPASGLYRDADSGLMVRHHIHPTALQRAFKLTKEMAGILQSIGCHTLRHCFAAHLLEGGTEFRTTMIYTHVVDRG